MVPYLELWRFYAREKCHIQHLTTGYEDVPGSYYLFADPSLGDHIGCLLMGSLSQRNIASAASQQS